MIFYKCHFMPLWTTTLLLGHLFVVVGGQTLGSLARHGCLRRCSAVACPKLEPGCVCPGLGVIRPCFQWACAVGEVADSFSSLVADCLPFLRPTTTSKSLTPRTITTSWRTTVPAPGPTGTARGSPRPCAKKFSAFSKSTSSGFTSSSFPSPSSNSSRDTTMTSNSTTSLANVTCSTALTETTLSTSTTPTQTSNAPREPPSGPNVPPTCPPATNAPSCQAQAQANGGVIAAAVLGSLGFLIALLGISVLVRRYRWRNRRSMSSAPGIRVFSAGAGRGSITGPLPAFSPRSLKVTLADPNSKSTTPDSQMSGLAGTATTAVGTTGGASTITVSPVRSTSQLYLFPPTSRRPSVTQPQRLPPPDLLRSLGKPLPQLPRYTEEARPRPRLGSSVRSSSVALPPTVYPVVDSPRPMSAISELTEVDLYQPIGDISREVEFIKVYREVRRVLSRSPSTSTDQNSTDWSIMTDLSRDSTVRSAEPEGREG